MTLAERREADGEVWHLPAAPPLTAQQFLDPILEAAGRPTPAKPRRSRSDARDRRTLLAAHAGLRETTYQFHAPFVADSSKFERAFDPFDATSHHEAIEHSAQWFRSRGG